MCLESRMCCFGEIVPLFSFGERLVFPGAVLSDQGTGTDFSTEFLYLVPLTLINHCLSLWPESGNRETKVICKPRVEQNSQEE